MTVLLLESFVPDKVNWGSFSVEKGHVLPLGMLAIYIYLKSKGIETLFVDTQFGDFTVDHLKSLLSDKEIKVVGIPVFTNSAYYSFKTAKLCKEIRSDLIVVLGGVHATILAKETLQENESVDYLIMGEAEESMAELITNLSHHRSVDGIPNLAYRHNGIIHTNPPRPFITNLDDLPMTCYDGINLSRYIPHPTQYTVLPNQAFITQRGCPYPCAFCEASAVMGKRVRRYSPDRVIAELDVLVKKHGTRGIYFQDSTFTVDAGYTVELMEKLIKSNLKILWACNTRADKVTRELLKLMKRAGCWMVNYGVESGNQASLDKMRKCMKVSDNVRAVEGAKAAGLDVFCNFILCIPGETEAMARQTIQFAKKLLPDIAMFYLPMPYPTSDLAQICRQSGGLRENASWKDYLLVDFDNPVYINPLIGKEKMRSIYRQAYREFYLNPFYLLRCIRKFGSWVNALRMVRGFRVLFSLLKHR